MQQSTANGTVRLLDPAYRIAAKGSLEACLDAGQTQAPAAEGDRAVILLHGLGRGRIVMRRMEHALRKAGWTVANVGYPSLRRPLAYHVDAVRCIARALHQDGAHEIALVGHSLGGLVARMTAVHAGEDGWTLGRIVLVGSPAQGSAIAEALKDFPPFRAIAGECGRAVTPLHAIQVPVPATEIAIIAGGNGKNGYNPFLTGDNDGIVTVDETRLPGTESAFLLLPSTHTRLPMRHDTVAATLSFLETGHLLTQLQAGRS
ncbi:alpha/beta fold hydrolase [Acidisphaera sp. S103]|uniref:alpha/beta fold hydrolase n=1 Tax=Acidisphaera sp. S103 TaxID=1747223 RepID=UPI00131ECB50|nr:alpha/beta fold hydrolase [Acidisphaera sp. S103]